MVTWIEVAPHGTVPVSSPVMFPVWVQVQVPSKRAQSAGGLRVSVVVPEPLTSSDQTVYAPVATSEPAAGSGGAFGPPYASAAVPGAPRPTAFLATTLTWTVPGSQ
jgi:hypothetical protein